MFRKVAVVLLIILIPSLVWANILLRRRGIVAVSGVATTTTTSVAVSYLLEESFDTPTGDGYDNVGWTEDGNMDTDYTTAPAPLEGTQSLFLDSGGGYDTTWIAYTAQDFVSVYMIVNFSTWTGFSNRILLTIEDSDGANLGFLYKSDTEKIGVQHGALDVLSSNVFIANTTYHFWLDYTKGTGADGISRFYYSTNGVKPGTPEAEVTNGDATAQGARIELRSYQAEFDVIYDKLRVDDEVIGSNPP